MLEYRYQLNADSPSIAIEEEGAARRREEAFDLAKRLSREYEVPMLVRDQMARRGSVRTWRVQLAANGSARIEIVELRASTP